MSAPTWTQNLDLYESALTRAQAALASGEWPQDGWTAPSLAVPSDEPTDGELARYRRLSVLSDSVQSAIRDGMRLILDELGQGPKHRDAARAYAQASVIESRSAATV